MRVAIPKSAVGRGERTYARLVRSVTRSASGLAFEGKLLRCGDSIEESELWPDDDYPAVPLLIEFAGRAVVGRGHNRSSWLYILWRFEPHAHVWRELARTASVGAEWVDYLRPIALLEMGRKRADPDDVAARVSRRVLIVLDGELDCLADDERLLAISLIYEQVTARLAELDRCA